MTLYLSVETYIIKNPTTFRQIDRQKDVWQFLDSVYHQDTVYMTIRVALQGFCYDQIQKCSFYT